MMDLPPIASIPPESIRKSMELEEWQSCLDSWIFLLEQYLLLPSKAFTLKIAKDTSLTPFIISYGKNHPSSYDTKSIVLRKNCFLLFHRSLTEVKPVPGVLLDWNLMADFSLIYNKVKALPELLNRVWAQENLDANITMVRNKAALIRMLEVSHLNPELERLLPPTMALLRVCYRYGQFLMIGTDFIDALSTAYTQKPRLQKKIMTIAYFSLISLMTPEVPKIFNLLDHLYSLNPQAQPNALLKGLAESTPLIQKLRSSIIGSEAGRAQNLMQSLQKYEKGPDGRPKRGIRRKLDKGKRKASEDGEFGHGMVGNVHVHKLSLVSQVQDLFPDLGSAFIVKLLDEYKDNTEVVIAHLLEGTLPLHLKDATDAERSEELPQIPSQQNHDLAPDLSPRHTPPRLPTRRNIYDDDDFDRLAVDASKLHIGRRNKDLTADDLLAAERPSSQKAAILSALAAIDPDDDERDDSYDIADVGGAIDTTNEDNADDLKGDVHEEALLNAYNTTPNLFNRNADTRRSKARAALKTETDMTDEAIEGWGIMIRRDPRRLDRLQRKFEMSGAPQQRSLEGTAWRDDHSGTEDSDTAGVAAAATQRGGRGGTARGMGRGRGRGHVGKGGAVTGPSGDPSTQAARQRKDANKGSRANHNRRDQRARKMARGGFAG